MSAESPRDKSTKKEAKAASKSEKKAHKARQKAVAAEATAQSVRVRQRAAEPDDHGRAQLRTHGRGREGRACAGFCNRAVAGW